jgi:hypothetical protein
MRRILPLFAVVGLLAGCSTDLEVNAPYKDIPVIYGLLNQCDSIHFVRINKAYLGEGDAYQYAAIPDSNEYDPEVITKRMVYEIVNGNRVDSFPLRDTIVEREPGIFHTTQRVYYFTRTTPPVVVGAEPHAFKVYLDQNARYELYLVINGKELRAVTNIVNDFQVQSADASPNVGINFVNNNGYIDYELNWTTGIDGKRTEVSYRFNYDEVRGSDTVRKSVTRRIGKVIAANPDAGNESQSLLIGGEAFFSGLAAAIPYDPGVDKRIFTGIDFLFTVANEDFNTFLSLSEPVSGIIEDRPAWSNIAEAYGIWGSRFTKKTGKRLVLKKLNDATTNELMNGPYTADRRFCSGFHAGPPYGCN